MSDTRTDACPFCGAEKNGHSIIFFQCHSGKNQRSVLCKEREARQTSNAALARAENTIVNLRMKIADMHEELCRHGLREYGN